MSRKAFIDPELGYPNVYALRAHNRLLADAYYLARFAQLGHSVAASMTCERYGHDARGGMCDRCGLGTGVR